MLIILNQSNFLPVTFYLCLALKLSITSLNSAPGPATAPAGDTSGLTLHSSVQTCHLPSRPVWSPRLSSPLSAQYVWCRWHTVSQCRNFPGLHVCARPAVVPVDRGTATVSGFPKQLDVPLWQVGPIGLTNTSKDIVIAIRVMLTTLRKLPEVSPFVHRRCLVRAVEGHFAAFLRFHQRVLIHISQH